MRRSLISTLLTLTVLASMLPTGGGASAASQQRDSYTELVQLCTGEDYVGSIQFQLGSTEMVVDGTSIPIDAEQDGVVPLVSQGRTMLPARALVEALHGSIDYEDGQVTITAGDGVQIQLAGDDDVMRVDGTEVRLDVAPLYAQNRTFLPVRAVSESLSCDVAWEADTQTVTITQPCQTRRLVVQAESVPPSASCQELLVLGGGLYVLVYSTVAETEQALQALTEAGIPAWPDAPVEVESDGASAGWEDARCGLSDFARLQAGNRSVTVAVIDSGVDASLPLFQNRLTEGFDFVEGQTGIPEDRYGHGTFVSGLIAQYTPAQVRLLPIRIFDEEGLCPVYLSILAAALRYAQQSGADIINMSLSMYRTPALEQIIQSLIAQEVAVVCSAGNEGRDTAQYTPACLREAIVVAATNPADEPAVFSNYGATVDLAAPGQAITFIGAGGQTQTMSGTSFSAPLVTAAGAVLLTQRDCTPAALERSLLALTSPFSAEITGYGSGILNLYTTPERPEEPVPTLKPMPTLQPIPTPEPAPESTPQPGPTPSITAYQFSSTELSMGTGEHTSLQVHALYSDGSVKDVTNACGLYSTNPKVAEVKDGGVTALETGTAWISLGAVPDGVAIPAPVRVDVQSSAEKSSFYNQEWQLRVGNSGALCLLDDDLVYQCGDPSIVSVTTEKSLLSPNHTQYLITAQSPGETTVIFSPRYGGRPIQIRVIVTR